MPTLKQKRAFKAVGENGGNISKAMKTAGYAPSIIHATEKLTTSVGWQELMEQHLPDKLLAKRHRELLNKREKVIIQRTQGKSPIYEVLDQPETNAVSKGLEMAYKLKGKIQDTAPQSNNTQIINVNFFSHPEIMEATKKLDELLIKQIYDNEIK